MHSRWCDRCLKEDSNSRPLGSPGSSLGTLFGINFRQLDLQLFFRNRRFYIGALSFYRKKLGCTRELRTRFLEAAYFHHQPNQRERRRRRGGGDSSTPTFLMRNSNSLMSKAFFLGNLPSSTAPRTANRKS